MLELENYIREPENPWSNLELAMWYHNIDHTAPAITFYLRCAERTNNDSLAYACLIQLFRLFSEQGRRHLTALNCINRAIDLLPDRPEAYWTLSQHYERKQHWQTAYMQATLGLRFAKHDLPQLPISIGYPGYYALIFEKSVAAWWWGKKDESRKLTVQLYNDYLEEMDEDHRNAVINNIKNCNIDVDLSQEEN